MSSHGNGIKNSILDPESSKKMDLTLKVQKEVDFKMHVQLRPSAGKIKLDVDVIKTVVKGTQITKSQAKDNVAAREGVAKCPIGDKMRSGKIPEREREVLKSPLEIQIGTGGAACDGISAAPQSPRRQSTDRLGQISLNPLTLGGYLPADHQKLIFERKSKSGQNASTDFSAQDKTEASDSGGKNAAREPAKFTARLLDKSKHGGATLSVMDDESSLFTQAATGIFNTTDESHHELNDLNAPTAETEDTQKAQNKINASPINFQNTAVVTKRELSSDKRVLSDLSEKKKELNLSDVSPNKSSQDDIVTWKHDAPDESSDIDHIDDSISEPTVAEVIPEKGTVGRSRKPKQQTSSPVQEKSGLSAPTLLEDKGKGATRSSKNKSEFKKEIPEVEETAEGKLVEEKQETTSASAGKNPMALDTEIIPVSIEELQGTAEKVLDKFQAQREVEKLDGNKEATAPESASTTTAEEKNGTSKINQTKPELLKTSGTEEYVEVEKTLSQFETSEISHASPNITVEPSEPVQDPTQGEEENEPQIEYGQSKSSITPEKKANQQEQINTSAVKVPRDDQNFPREVEPLEQYEAGLPKKENANKVTPIKSSFSLDPNLTQSDKANGRLEKEEENRSSSIILEKSLVKTDPRSLIENTPRQELDVPASEEPEKSHSLLPAAPTPNQYNMGEKPNSGEIAPEGQSPEKEILRPHASSETASIALPQTQLVANNLPAHNSTDHAIASGGETDPAKDAKQSLREVEKTGQSPKKTPKINGEAENLISRDDKNAEKPALAIKEIEKTVNLDSKEIGKSNINETSKVEDIDEKSAPDRIVELALNQQESLEDAHGLHGELPKKSEQQHGEEPHKSATPITTCNDMPSENEPQRMGKKEKTGQKISATFNAENEVIEGQIELQIQQATAKYQPEETSEQNKKEKPIPETHGKVDIDAEIKSPFNESETVTKDVIQKAKEKSAEVRPEEFSVQKLAGGITVEEIQSEVSMEKLDTTHDSSSEKAPETEQDSISKEVPSKPEQHSKTITPSTSRSETDCSSDDLLIPSNKEEVSAEEPLNSPEPGVTLEQDRNIDDGLHAENESPTDEQASPSELKSRLPFCLFLWLLLTASQFLLYLKVAVYLYFLINVFYAKQIFLYSLTMVHIALHITEERRQKKPNAKTLFTLAIAWFLAGLYIRYLVSIFDYVYSPFIYCYFKVVTDYL